MPLVSLPACERRRQVTRHVQFRRSRCRHVRLVQVLLPLSPSLSTDRGGHEPAGPWTGLCSGIIEGLGERVGTVDIWDLLQPLAGGRQNNDLG